MKRLYSCTHRQRHVPPPPHTPTHISPSMHAHMGHTHTHKCTNTKQAHTQHKHTHNPHTHTHNNVCTHHTKHNNNITHTHTHTHAHTHTPVSTQLTKSSDLSSSRCTEFATILDHHLLVVVSGSEHLQTTGSAAGVHPQLSLHGRHALLVLWAGGAVNTQWSHVHIVGFLLLFR